MVVLITNKENRTVMWTKEGKDSSYTTSSDRGGPYINFPAQSRLH